MGEQGPSFYWGEARFVRNDDGKIVDLFIDENVSRLKRVELVETAANEHLRSNYIRTLERNIPTKKLTERMPDRIAKAKELGMRMFQLREIFDSVEPNSSEWYYTRYLMQLLVKNTKEQAGIRIFRSIRF